MNRYIKKIEAAIKAKSAPLRVAQSRLGSRLRVTLSGWLNQGRIETIKSSSIKVRIKAKNDPLRVAQ